MIKENDKMIKIIMDLKNEEFKNCNENYFFQDISQTIFSEEESGVSMVVLFLNSYLARVKHLCYSDPKLGSNFIKWFNIEGNKKILSLLKRLDEVKVNRKNLVKVLNSYDVLMEQALDENDSDCLLNVLIDIPIGLYEKLEKWKWFVEEKMEYIYNAFSTYKTNEPNNIELKQPAEMQVFLL